MQAGTASIPVLAVWQNPSSPRMAPPRGRSHRKVHEPKCISRNRVSGQDLDAVEDTLACSLHIGDKPFRGLAPSHR